MLVAECFDLPKAITAGEATAEPRLSLELEEAIHILELLPSLTLIDRRNRAMFALAYMSALRESALISLRMEHLENRHSRRPGDSREEWKKLQG